MILDTHAWLFYATGKRLDKAGLRKIDRARSDGRLHVAAVTLWEIALLAQERKLRFALPTREWFKDALTRTEVGVVPLDAAVAIESARLLQTLRDPADCQVVGTALQMGAPLATRDARILENAGALGLEVVEV